MDYYKNTNIMRIIILGLLLGLIATTFAVAHAEYSTFILKGSGAAVINSDNPKLYNSVLHMSLSGISSVSNGIVIMKGDNLSVVARFIPNTWSFSYGNNGSFHGEGQVQSNDHESYAVSLDGTRVFATSTGSMWKVSATMQSDGKKFVLNYLLLGNDPIPTINVANNAEVLIPNGNSAQANTGFFLPLNLEIMRGTIVTWQNQDNIGHTVQSQDEHGNVIPLFNSGLLHTGDTFSYKFDKPGVYHYFCTIHPWRIGIVTVN
ncbi:MAG: plastocyanin/azurin family copper-binding protein [Nitrososphaera sp.]|jgi:plastocyanin